MRKIVLASIGILLAGCAAQRVTQPFQSTNSSSSANIVSGENMPSDRAVSTDVISRARERVTKKPFGTYVSPSSSPVSPERFTGYHTGEDFETFPEEQDSDVPINALCTGTVRFTGWVKGYGGVLIEQCDLHGDPVTVLYGHLNIDSITLKSGDVLKAGEHIGVLGKGYSPQTDGERKHLHLGVHKGTTLEYRGYVQTEKELDDWIDPFAG